jgi:hypothetical protein
MLYPESLATVIAASANSQTQSDFGDSAGIDVAWNRNG